MEQDVCFVQHGLLLLDAVLLLQSRAPLETRILGQVHLLIEIVDDHVLGHRLLDLGEDLQVGQDLDVLHVGYQHQHQAIVVDAMSLLDQLAVVPVLEIDGQLVEPEVELGVLEQQQGVEHLRSLVHRYVDVQALFDASHAQKEARLDLVRHVWVDLELGVEALLHLYQDELVVDVGQVRDDRQVQVAGLLAGDAAHCAPILDYLEAVWSTQELHQH